MYYRFDRWLIPPPLIPPPAGDMIDGLRISFAELIPVVFGSWFVYSFEFTNLGTNKWQPSIAVRILDLPLLDMVYYDF